MKKLILYITFLYPNEKKFFEILEVINKKGVDIVEFGIPVSNPIMDGKTIRDTHAKVLKNGLKKETIERVLKEVRNKFDFEVILMTYKEGIDNYSLLKLDENLHDGILCVDHDLTVQDKTNIIKIYNEKLSISELSFNIHNNTGFAYVMSGVGETGSFENIPDGYLTTLPILRKLIELPLYVGFGIKSPSEAKEIVSNGADGVIIGSYFINLYNSNGLEGIGTYVEEMKDAIS